MKNTTQQRRPRSRGGRRNNGNNPNNKGRVFDSNGPDVRIRGTAVQIVEKYTTLARDAHAAGDTIATETFFQHAEHYQRIVNEWDDELVNGPRKIVKEVRVSHNKDMDENVGNKAEAIEDDLGLPSSILGKEAPVAQTRVLEPELA
tara:strand:+ start:280305 stop:280742 length:438 start_codon:yes stop_codon:yes gene_type:complete